jgi:7-cyano-7-deazaguanine synthase in queuosine biosynthesis
MKHTVVWSGGMDSTLILCDLVKKGVKVNAIVFETDNFGILKKEFEERARFDIMRYLKKEIDIQKVKLDFPITNGLKGYNGGMFQQPSMITLLSIFGEDETTYHMGYHKGDDFFAHQYDMLKSSDLMLKVMGDKNIKFSFPLRFSTKEQIVATIQDWGLDKLTHFCEYPNRNIATGRCGECVPCRTYEDALTMMDVHKRNQNGTYQGAHLAYDCKFDYECEVLKCVDEPVEQLKDLVAVNT